MGETQRLNTGRSSEFADQAGGSGTSPGYDIKSVVKVDGNLSSLNPLTGSTINFTTGRDGVSFFSASFWLSGFQIFVGAVLTIVVDGVSYTLAEDGRVNGAGSDRETQSSVSGSLGVNLLAGSHTAYLSISNSGLGIVCSAGNPITLTVIYPTVNGDVATASPLTKQEVGPLAGHQITGGTGPTVVPGSTITVVLTAPQTVIVMGYGTFDDPGNNRCHGSLSARVVRPGPVTTDYLGTTSNGGNDVNDAAAVVTRAIDLPIGTSTISLLHDDTGTTSNLLNSVLTVVYTTPAALPPNDFAFTEATATGGEFDTTSATFVDVTGTTVSFTLTDVKNVIVKAEFTGIRDAGDTDITAYYALSVDGVDYKKGSLKLSLSGGFNGRWPLHIEKFINLAAGSHTVKLRLKSDGTHNSRIASSTDEPTVVTVQYIV